MLPHLLSNDQVKVARLEEWVSFIPFRADCRGMAVDVHIVFRGRIGELTEFSTLFAIELTELVISTYSMVTYVCAKQHATV